MSGSNIKPLDELTIPDSRLSLFNLTLSDLHEQLAEIELGESVPNEVREQFETAKNLALYAGFVYDLNPAAELHGYLGLEAALNARADQAGQKPKRSGLKALLKHALAESWIRQDKMKLLRTMAAGRVRQRKSFEAIEKMRTTGAHSIEIDDPTDAEILEEMDTMQVIDAICDAAVSLRNALAHGERILHPHSVASLRTTADLINQLWP